MEAMYLWPGSPLASIFALWVASVIFLWAARNAMLRLLNGLGHGLADGLHSVARRCAGAAEELHKSSRKVLLAAGTRDAQGRLDRELQRVDDGFSDQLGQYGRLQRQLDDTLLAVERDYKAGGIAPPEVPGWSAAVEAIANIPMAGDPNIQKVLDGIRASSEDAEKKALAAYQADTTKRHKILAAMLPAWKDIRGLLGRMQDSVTLALESSARINAFIEDYEKLRQNREEAARALTFSAAKLFLVAAGVLGIAFGAAFINFQLIALPMSELVPAGARVGGVPVSTVSALVLVLMEAALGIFLMDMLGITELFPKLGTIPRSRKRMILWLGIAGLFFLASVESSLAILREQIVEADSALKLSLAGEESRIVQSASQSMIPVIGQAVLGFILPWILALVAVPLEMLLDCGRHVLASLAVVAIRFAGVAASGAGHVSHHLTGLITSVYDVYIAIPLRLEAMLTGGRKHSDRRPGAADPSPERSLA
ncbi:MAG: hypothetical protein VX466_03475 [Myxococcota bacterium]|nr:hypothetical protein [Myxococcota bacterium]